MGQYGLFRWKRLHSLHLTYTLKGGSSLRRSYGSIPIYREDLDKAGSVTNLVNQLLQDRELVARAYNFEAQLNGCRLTGASLYYLNKDGKEYYDNVYVDNYAQELWDAVQADFAEGTIGVRYLFDDDPEQTANTYRTNLWFDLTPIAVTAPGQSVSAQPASQPYSTRSTIFCINLTPNARHTLAVLEKTGVFEEGYSLAPAEGSENGDTITYPFSW